MEYFVIDKNWVGLLVTKDLAVLKAFLDSNNNWDKVLKRINPGENWVFQTNKTEYNYGVRSSSIF